MFHNVVLCLCNIQVPSPERFSKALRIHGKGGHANRTHGVHDREQHSFKVMLVTPSSPIPTNWNVEETPSSHVKFPKSKQVTNLNDGA